ncbi:HAMP domain-containing sensor histidine kinase [Bdellovibrionota bacterium FG-1]
MKEPIPFRVWLPRQIRPVILVAGLIGIVLSSVTLVQTARDGIERWNMATQTWARSAEILISKRDIPTLEAVSEFLRHEYPSLRISISDDREIPQVLWSYPENGLNRELSDSRTFNRRIELNTTGKVSADLRINWLDVFYRVNITGVVVVFLLLLGMLSFIWILRLCTLRIVNEVDRLKFGSTSAVLELTELVKAREQAEKERTETKGKVALGLLATQVAHDIRSPLASLEMATKDSSGLPEDTRIIIRSAVGRIKDIAHTLLIQNRANSQSGSILQVDCSTHVENKSIQLLSSSIDEIISEKRMQFRTKLGIQISARLDEASYGLFSLIQPTEFKRVLSNLINNSVETLGEQGTIAADLSVTNEQFIQIRIQDNGKGIPAELLAKLGNRGETHGKEGGSGLGLFHARTSIENWGGKFAIDSKVGQGTTTLITLPKLKAPAWFADALRLQPKSTVVILDDDESIHHIWDGRADSSKFQEQGIKLVHLSTPLQVRNWISSSTDKTVPIQFLFDYELLDFKESGLDLVEKLGIARQTILVTSRYEELAIRERCEKLKLRMIPKGMAGFVPISIRDLRITILEDKSVSVSCVFVDPSAPVKASD